MRARQTEIQSQKTLLDHLESFSGKAPFTIAEIATGLAGHTAERTSWYRRLAARWGRSADRAARLMNNPAHFAQTRLTAATHYAENKLHEARVANKAVETRLARAVDRLPSWVKVGLRANLDKGITETTPVLSKTLPALKRVPYVGVGITAFGVGMDIAGGKNPAHAAVSGAGSMAAGAAVGAFIGGPVGIVVGGLVGAGVGYAVDEWGDDVWRATEGARDWVGDTAGDVARGIGNIFD